MKVPRINDFDPNATQSLGSPMDDLPTIQSPKKATTDPSTVAFSFSDGHRAMQGTNPVSIVGPNERSNERKKVRHTFDILADQLLALREIALEREKIFGGRVLLGSLAQEALDRFIANERNKE